MVKAVGGLISVNTTKEESKNAKHGKRYQDALKALINRIYMA
jgi:hypothetical protein